MRCLDCGNTKRFVERRMTVDVITYNEENDVMDAVNLYVDDTALEPDYCYECNSTAIEVN